MTTDTKTEWTTAAVLVGRLIFAALFIMAASFKLMDIDGTAAYIASAGFPLPKLLAGLAAVFELALVAGFLTGAYFSETSLLAAASALVAWPSLLDGWFRPEQAFPQIGEFAYSAFQGACNRSRDR